MKTQEILQKRLTEVLEQAPQLALVEELYNTVLAPLHATAQIFYPKLGSLPDFEGIFPRWKLNVESCYDLLELIELIEQADFKFMHSTDYPENKNRDYHFFHPIEGSHNVTLTLEAYFSSVTCRKKQIGTTPVYEMSCNMDEAPTTEVPTTEEPNDDLPF